MQDSAATQEIRLELQSAVKIWPWQMEKIDVHICDKFII